MIARRKIYQFVLLLCISALSLCASAQSPAGPADFGDLPNAGTPGAPVTYKTRITDAGPWHLIDTRIHIGTLIDNDGDGFPHWQSIQMILLRMEN